MHTGARRTKGSKDKMSVWVVCVCERREFLCCCDRQKNTVCAHKCHIRMRSRLLTSATLWTSLQCEREGGWVNERGIEIKIKEAPRTATELMNAIWIFIYETDIKKWPIFERSGLNVHDSLVFHIKYNLKSKSNNLLAFCYFLSQIIIFQPLCSKRLPSLWYCRVTFPHPINSWWAN